MGNIRKYVRKWGFFLNYFKYTMKKVYRIWKCIFISLHCLLRHLSVGQGIEAVVVQSIRPDEEVNFFDGWFINAIIRVKTLSSKIFFNSWRRYESHKESNQEYRENMVKFPPYVMARSFRVMQTAWSLALKLQERERNSVGQ